MRYSYSTQVLFPIEILHGLLFRSEDNELKEIETNHPVLEKWGDCETFFSENEDVTDIQKSEFQFLSLVEKKIYAIEIDLTSHINTFTAKRVEANIETYFQDMVIGFTPYGGIAIWLSSSAKQVLVKWLKATEVTDKTEGVDQKVLNSVCDDYINNLTDTKSYLEENGLPHRNLFDNYMKQFIYRYLTLFDKWTAKDEKWTKYTEEDIQPEFDYIEEMLYDGTHDKLHDGGLMKYHEAGKPKKLAVKWHIKKSEYSAYFWFEEDGIRAVFDKFYGAHPDTKTDFIIHIDPENRKYELSLYRYGLKQPQIIPESAYQLIVFKNQFENYRSDNYNQQRGAWIW